MYIYVDSLSACQNQHRPHTTHTLTTQPEEILLTQARHLPCLSVQRDNPAHAHCAPELNACLNVKWVRFLRGFSYLLCEVQPVSTHPVPLQPSMHPPSLPFLLLSSAPSILQRWCWQWHVTDLVRHISTISPGFRPKAYNQIKLLVNVFVALTLDMFLPFRFHLCSL